MENMNKDLNNSDDNINKNNFLMNFVFYQNFYPI